MASRTAALFLFWMCLVHAIGLTAGPAVTPPPDPRRRNASSLLEKRQDVTTELSTCGYLNGDPNNPRTANSGYDCRVDTEHGLWGFCPTTVISATDCGLAAACQDSGSCFGVCGYTNNPSLTTFTCSASNAAYCSTALLTFGVDQTYAYIACGAGEVTDHLLISPTATPSSLTPSSSTAKSPSVQISSSSPAPESISSSPAPTTSPSGNSPNNTGAIIGGVIGGLALVCVSAIAVAYLARRDRTSKRVFPASPQAGTGPDTPFNEPTTKQGGWGPSELPANDRYSGPPMELPTDNGR